MCLSRLKADDRGANAIEYAIIAALIGIGLIGSLVGTKGSLSAIFGVAATQMGSSSGSTASTGGVQFAPFQTKTLSGAPIKTSSGSNYQVQWNYTDGSSVSFNYQPDMTDAQRISMYEASTKTYYYYYTDLSGNPTTFYYEVRNNPRGILSMSWSTPTAGLSSGTPISETITSYDANRNPTSSQTGAPDANYLNTFTASVKNLDYYKAQAQ